MLLQTFVSWLQKSCTNSFNFPILCGCALLAVLPYLKTTLCQNITYENITNSQILVFEQANNGSCVDACQTKE
jgi:hypothetical protein